MVAFASLPKLLPVHKRNLRVLFRKFTGLLVFLELGVSINVHNKKNLGGFGRDNGTTILNEGLF